LPHRTAYSRVAEKLRRDILAGRRKAGERLPSEAELSRQFRTSRITTRQALQILNEEGLITRRQGLGTFVAAKPIRKIPIINADFFTSVTRHAPELERELITFDWQSINGAAVEALQLPREQRALHAVRVDRLQGKPVATDEVHCVEECGRLLSPEDLTALDFMERWRTRIGAALAYGTQVVEAVPAPAVNARRLGVRARSVLLRESNVLYLAGGQPVAHFESYYRPGCFRFEATVPLNNP